jgi:hypothetical protein
MKTLIVVLLLFSAVAFAADFHQAKLIDVQGFKQAGPPIIAPNNGYPVVIPTSQNMFTITVAFGDMSYSGQFQESRHFKPSQLIVGDSIQARIDGEKLILKTAAGREEKAKIIRRERLKPQSAN